MSDVAILSIRLYGQEIGTLTHVAGDRTLFAFTEAYINQSNRPVLSVGFKDQLGGLLTDFRPYKAKLMPYFSNLLPEGRLRQYLAMKAGVNADREFFLLQALGEDLPGAITASATSGHAWPVQPDTDSHNSRVSRANRDALRFSLAGIQLKFSAIKCTRAGLTIPAYGTGGNSIVKLPSPEFPQLPENEFCMMSLAKMVGIKVPSIDLVDVSAIQNLPDGIAQLGQKAFVIERFDRSTDHGIIHIEDFAQVFRVYPQEKYSKASMRNIASVIAIESDHDDIAELVRRLTFNVLIGNGDMHLKNWSLIYPDQRCARLAPAYDYVSTIPYIPNDQFALTFSRSKRFVDYTLDELEHLSLKAALPRKLVTDCAKQTVAAFMQHWSEEKMHLPMNRQVVEAIDRHLLTLPIVTDAV